MRKVFLSLALVAAFLLLCPALSLAANDLDNFVFDISEGNIIVSGFSATHNKVLYNGEGPNYVDGILVPKNRKISIIGQSKGHVDVVKNADAIIELNNVSILGDMYRGYATYYLTAYYPGLSVRSDSKAHIILPDGTDNNFKNIYGVSGIEVDRGCSLVISGNGTLTAQGEGVSSGINADKGTVTINSGTINAIGGENGMGISGGNIIINGGTVTATSGREIGIGLAYRLVTEKVTINGGTIDADYITGRKDYDGSLIINGGSVDAYDITPTPMNDSGKRLYRATMITNEKNEKVNNVLNQYGLNDVKSNKDKKLFFYLPENSLSDYTGLLYGNNVYKARVNANGTALFSMEEPLSIDETGQQVRYYVNRGFQVKSTPSGVTGFRVEYGDLSSRGEPFTTKFPVEPGTYAVRVTRPRDREYVAFEKIIYPGITLLDSFNYSVAYYGNGATGGEMENSTHAYGIEKELSANGFTKAGYEFVGWDTDKDGKNVVYRDCEKVVSLTNKEYGLVKLYAVWRPVDYSVNYLPGQYGSGAAQKEIKEYNKDITLKGGVFTRVGYAQTGWSTEDGGEIAYGLLAKYTPNASIDLYPVWTEASVVIIDANGQTSICEDLTLALRTVRDGETIRLSKDCEYAGNVVIPVNVSLDMGGFGLKCDKLTVSFGSKLIIGKGQPVDISPNGESDSPSRFKGLRLMGDVINEGNITFNGAIVQGIGTIRMKSGYITLKGASAVNKIWLDKGVRIELDESFMAGGISGIVYLPKDSYVNGYEILSGYVELESYFSLGNAPDNSWLIGEDGRLIGGLTGVKPEKPNVIPEHLVIGEGSTLDVNNLFPDSFKGETNWKSDDRDVLQIVEKKGKKLLSGVKEGETTLSLIIDGKTVEEIPVAVVSKDKAVKNLKGKGEIKLRPGERKPVGLSVKPEEAADKTLFGYVDKPLIAKFENGEIIGVNKGSCRVTVVSTSLVRKTIKVTVTKFADIETARLSAIELTLKKGEKATIEAIITPGEADKSVKWSSENPKIAKVKAGVITAKKPGETAIMCKLSNGDKIGCIVKVVE